MPAGCEFICKNEQCSCFNSGFVMTSAWPVGNINLIINSVQVKEKPEFRQHLIKLRDSGQKTICIQFPNIDKIPTESYRIQMWDDKNKCIWAFYVQDPSDEEEIEQVSKKTEKQFKNYIETIGDGILCPHCQKELFQSRWFTKEI